MQKEKLMPLPKIAVPSYDTKMPSSGKKIEYRPFLVQEQKLLLMAAESKDTHDIERNIFAVMNECILTPDVDVNNFPSFDVDWLLIHMRKHSIGKNIELQLKHSPGVECDHVEPVKLNLDNVEVFEEKNHTKTFTLIDDIGVEMRYPSHKELSIFNENPIDESSNLIRSCIEKVYDKEEVYASFTPEEMEEWYGKLQLEQLEKFQEFFNTMPRVGIIAKWTCPKCGVKEKLKIEGLENLFIL